MYRIKFVNGGWAIKDPLEGWIGTLVDWHATTFSSEDEAKTIVETKYKDWKERAIVERVPGT